MTCNLKHYKLWNIKLVIRLLSCSHGDEAVRRCDSNNLKKCMSRWALETYFREMCNYRAFANFFREEGESFCRTDGGSRIEITAHNADTRDESLVFVDHAILQLFQNSRTIYIKTIAFSFADNSLPVTQVLLAAAVSDDHVR